MNTVTRDKMTKLFFGGAIALASAFVSETSRAGVVTTGIVQIDLEPAGYPWNAQRIAACGPSTLYALNYDHGLWVNDQGGSTPRGST